MRDSDSSIKDDLPLTFGKYKGKTPNQIAEVDPSYIVWMVEKTKKGEGRASRDLYLACLDIDKGRGACVW